MRFSLIVAVYNDWESLGACLRSLQDQRDPPSFEVIVVDDGSDRAAPAELTGFPFSFTLLRQNHSSIGAARNYGIGASNGSVLLFTDADCRLQPDCLSALDNCIANGPRHDFFQLNLTGDNSNLVGRAEELRLRVLQRRMLQPDGRIRYLNTAGFALRRTRVNIESGLFDPSVLRGEDTLLLAHLLQKNEMPFFVSGAMVRHAIPLSIVQCLRKDVRAAWQEEKTHRIIAASGTRVRMSDRDRLRMLRQTWATAADKSIGRSAWFLLFARRLVKRIVSLISRRLAPAYLNRQNRVPADHG